MRFPANPLSSEGLAGFCMTVVHKSASPPGTRGLAEKCMHPFPSPYGAALRLPPAVATSRTHATSSPTSSTHAAAIAA